jgi:hypothetical protein
MPTNLQQQVSTIVRAFAEGIDNDVAEWSKARTPQAFRSAELAVAKATRGLADAIAGRVLAHIVGEAEFQAVTSAPARGDGAYRSGGRREVGVTLLGGSEVRVWVEYLKPDRRRQPGPKRGKRGKGGVGLYPALAALGVWFGVTPAVADEICHQMSASDSTRAARQALARRDLDLGHKQTLRVFNHFSRRAVAQRNAWLQQMADAAPARGLLRGKRVAIATDGGRLRLRVPKRGRRRKATGHHRYDAPWREPKQLVIYTVDDDGKVDAAFRPVYDGTLNDCEALFDMLVGYLKGLGAHEARELIILGDGALWIWERTADLVQNVGVDPTRVTEVVDWSHAASVLHTIADVPAKWPQWRRKLWAQQAKNLLYAGDIDVLAEMIDTLGVGRRAKKVRKHKRYFTRNAHRMQYAAFEQARIPIGSGAVESALRQVVNLRMKGAGKFWDERNAQGMLLLRSYLKAGRFEDLVLWSLANAVPWWRPDEETRRIAASPIRQPASA